MAVTNSAGRQTNTLAVAVTQGCLYGIILSYLFGVFVAGVLLSNALFRKGSLYSLPPGFIWF